MNAITRPFSNVTVVAKLTVDVSACITAWFDRKGALVLDRGEPPALVSYYLDAGARGVFIETRALSVASLLDVLTLRVARSRGRDLLGDGVRGELTALPRRLGAGRGGPLLLRSDQLGDPDQLLELRHAGGGADRLGRGRRGEAPPRGRVRRRDREADPGPRVPGPGPPLVSG